MNGTFGNIEMERMVLIIFHTGTGHKYTTTLAPPPSTNHRIIYRGAKGIWVALAIVRITGKVAESFGVATLESQMIERVDFKSCTSLTEGRGLTPSTRYKPPRTH